MEPGEGPALIFDIGGGSTELMHVDVSDQDVRIHDWISVPWGVVSLTEHAPLPDDSLAGRQAAYAHMRGVTRERSEEHTSELQSLMRISYAVFCLKKQNTHK